MISENIRKGKLLIADPSISCDLSFSKSVVLLVDNSENGTVGFILNKPLEISLHDILPDISAQFTIYNGGPVECENLFFLHNIPDKISNSVAISDGIYWGGNFEMTKLLLNDGLIKKENIRFFLGYTGWGENQLTDEINLNSWISVENNYKSKIISKEATNFWREKLQELGGKYLYFANTPENPSWN